MRGLRQGKATGAPAGATGRRGESVGRSSAAGAPSRPVRVCVRTVGDQPVGDVKASA